VWSLSGEKPILAAADTSSKVGVEEHVHHRA
jgi:hypothetical protein